MSIRTTLSLDEEVVASLKEESRKRGVPFRRLLNDAIRAGLLMLQSGKPRVKLKSKPADLGLRPGISIDNIGEFLEQIEGESWR